MCFVIVDNTKDLDNAEMTPRLINFFKGYDVLVISKQEELTKLSNLKIKGIILSGGPILLSEKTELFRYSKNFTVLIEYTDVPILGICFGFQLLGMAHGGNVKSLGTQKREKIYEVIYQEDLCKKSKSCLFNNLPKQITVYQCHNDYLEKCPLGFTVTAKSSQGIIEAIECPEKLRFGVQFHPENSEMGHKILENFVAFCNKMETLKHRLALIK